MFSFGADFRKRSLVSRRSHRSQSLLSSFAPLPCAPIASPPFIFRIVQVIPPVGASWLTTSLTHPSRIVALVQRYPLPLDTTIATLARATADNRNHSAATLHGGVAFISMGTTSHAASVLRPSPTIFAPQSRSMTHVRTHWPFQTCARCVRPRQTRSGRSRRL